MIKQSLYLLLYSLLCYVQYNEQDFRSYISHNKTTELIRNYLLTIKGSCESIFELNYYFPRGNSLMGLTKEAIADRVN